LCFKTSFTIGERYKSNQITEEFKCAPRGGMRRSKKTKTLVLTSDHNKNLYSNRWEGDVLHYTGMGLNGDQNIDFSQNRTLNESQGNGVSVFLFEVFKQGEYVFLGQVELGGIPYQEMQIGKDGKERQVWMFPICLKSGNAKINQTIINEYEEEHRRKAKRMSLDMLLQRATRGNRNQVSYRSVKVKYFIRNSYVAELAKRLANGKCELCGEEAPFTDSQGNHYLEVHHIIWLSQGGADTISNTVALCPNCHRKMHILGCDEDVETLINQVANRDIIIN